jgi:ketosteroid isomerase-like protein
MTENSPTITYDGGTDADRAELLAQFEAFWDANNTLDIPKLREIWRDREDSVYFNSNGFNYYGFQDWLGIWRYYGPRFTLIKPATLGRVHMIVRQDLAVVTDGAVDRLFGVSEEVDGPPIASHPLMRATMVYTREEDGWKCVHAHYSPAAIEGKRPWAPET